MTHLLYMLFGGTLVALGVLAAAAADRVRGLRISREVAARASRTPAVPAARVVIPVVEAAPPKPARAPRAEPKAASDEGGDDVIAALVASGYKKPIAAEATWACGAGERATVESWVASALRRCARGGMS